MNGLLRGVRVINKNIWGIKPHMTVMVMLIALSLGISRAAMLGTPLVWDGRKPVETQTMPRSQMRTGEYTINIYGISDCDVKAHLTWTHVGRDFFNADTHVYDKGADVNIFRSAGRQYLTYDNNKEKDTGYSFAIQSMRINVISVRNCSSPHPEIVIQHDWHDPNTSRFQLSTVRKYEVTYDSHIQTVVKKSNNSDSVISAITPSLAPGNGYKYRLALDNDTDPLCRTIKLGHRWPITKNGDLYQYAMELSVNGHQQSAGEHTCILTLSVSEPVQAHPFSGNSRPHTKIQTHNAR